MKFLPEDRVICVNPGPYKELKMGGVYTVRWVSADGGFIHLREVRGGLFPQRFRRIDSGEALLSLEEML